MSVVAIDVVIIIIIIIYRVNLEKEQSSKCQFGPSVVIVP